MQDKVSIAALRAVERSQLSPCLRDGTAGSGRYPESEQLESCGFQLVCILSAGWMGWCQCRTQVMGPGRPTHVDRTLVTVFLTG